MLIIAVYCELKLNYNIVVVDYSNSLLYYTYLLYLCCGFTQVADDGADFIVWLQQRGMAQASRTHIIGFSNGAHLAAGIAERVRDRDSGRYGLVDRVDGEIHVDYLLKRQVFGEMILTDP